MKVKGATSFAKVTLAELNRVFKEDALILVSKRFAEAAGLDYHEMKITSEVIKAAAKKIEVTEFDWKNK